MPHEHLAAAMGIKLAPALSGFVGGCVALSFLQGLTRTQGVMTVATGAFTAGYLQPLVSGALALPDGTAGGVGFLLGVTAMGLMGWLVKASADPLSLWKRLRGQQQGPDE